MESVLAEGRERTLLTGNVTLVADDIEITAERIELYGEDLNFALSEGGVRVVQPEQGIEIASDSLLFDRRDRVVRIRGEALLIDHDNEMVIKGGFLEHWERRDETLIQIGVRILSEDLVARAQFVRYHRGGPDGDPQRAAGGHLEGRRVPSGAHLHRPRRGSDRARRHRKRGTQHRRGGRVRE